MNTKAMYKLSYGLFVLTAKVGDKINGCITNTAIQVASEPNQISFAVNKANYTHEMLMKTDACNISVISEEADFELFKHFGFQSGKDVDKFAGFTDCTPAANGVPYITKGTNAYFSIIIKQHVDLGSHTLFIGEVAEMEVLSEVPSATYSYYQANIKPIGAYIKRVVGYTGELVFDSTKPEGRPHMQLDTSRLFATGWRPEMGLEDSIKDAYGWYVENR